jgi:hypothetical protein
MPSCSITLQANFSEHHNAAAAPGATVPSNQQASCPISMLCRSRHNLLHPASVLTALLVARGWWPAPVTIG